MILQIEFPWVFLVLWCFMAKTLGRFHSYFSFQKNRSEKLTATFGFDFWLRLLKVEVKTSDALFWKKRLESKRPTGVFGNKTRWVTGDVAGGERKEKQAAKKKIAQYAAGKVGERYSGRARTHDTQDPRGEFCV